MGPQQIQPQRVRMVLNLMTMKVYLTLSVSSEEGPHNQMLFIAMPRTPTFWLEVACPSAGRNTVSVF